MKNLALITIFVTLVSAGGVPVDIVIPREAIVISENDGYTVVALNSLPANMTAISTTEPGTPLLPVISGNVLIPADARLKSVRLKDAVWQELGSGLRIYPVQPMRPLSRFKSIPFVQPRSEVYSTNTPYPNDILSGIPEGSKSGFRIAGFLFCPFRYFPASGKLMFATSAQLEVEYEVNSAPIAVLSPGQYETFREDVRHLVVNPADVDRWSPVVAELDGKEVDVVIVTSSTLVPALTGFARYLQRKGYFTEIIPTETVYARYPGRDNPEKIRNMLKNKFAHQGLKYVILAGDVQHVPCRYGYLPYSPYNVPADLYFADLDGTWDANNNGQFGEYSDTNFNPDSVDLYCDIVVGRLPLDDAAHCAIFLHKDSLYERHPDTTYLHNVLLPFEALWSNIDYYGRIVNKNIALTLSGMATWLVDSVYNMTPNQCIASINNGRHLFHFAGHGSYNGFGSTFSTSNLTSLTNSTRPCIVNSMACDCGNFDQYDCLAEQFITISNGGAVSTCLNARYGWGAPPNMGPSENLCMEFYNNYRRGFNQGRAYALAKDFYRNAAFSQMTYRWSVYDWILQGDPTMLMWRQPPRLLQVNCPDTIPAGPQMLPVTVNYAGYGPAAGARVAVLHGNELLGRAVTNSAGRAMVVLPNVADTWTLTVAVTAQDGRPLEKTVCTRSETVAPLVVYDHYWVDDANGRPDPGEEVGIYLVVSNRGNLVSRNTTGTVSCSSPYLVFTDSTASYDSILPGDTARGDFYRLRVSPNCPQGTRVEMVLKVNAQGITWESQLELVIGMPYARNGIWAIHDTGDFVIGVCANGGIGTTTWRGEGLGLIYPKRRQWSSSAMMHGSFLLGIAYPDTFWVADNYYAIPWQVTPQDFVVVESLQPVLPPELGNQEYICVFSDAHHPQPRGITVTQRSFVSARTQHKDFIVLEYRIHNNDTVPITNLWTGVACDFRTAPWNSIDTADYAGVDSVRAMAYIKASPETLALGVRPIYPPGANYWANCINHNTYVNDGFSKSEKIRFLDGRLRSTTGNTKGNWHALASAGPFTIPVGDSQIVAFVICGGRTVAQMSTNSDTAMEWYEPQVGVRENEAAVSTRCLIRVRPKVFSRSVTIEYQLNRIEPLTVTVCDASGRKLERLDVPADRLSGSFNWQPRFNRSGVFFINVNGTAAKVVRAR